MTTVFGSRGRRREFAAFTVGATVALVALAAAMALPASAEGEFAVIRLSPGDNITKTFQSVNVNNAGETHTPAECREGAETAATCDVIRVKLDRDESEDAVNFLRVELTWDTGYEPPPLMLAVVGLSAGGTNDLDMYVYDEDGNEIEAGGATAAKKEVAGVTAGTDVYDIVVNVFTGAVTEYTMNFLFSNEIFATPFEALDPATGGSFTAPSDLSADPAAPAVAAPLASVDDTAALMAPPAVVVGGAAAVTSDSDFSGFRASADDALQGDLAVFSPGRAAAPPPADPPSTWAIIFWLVAVPVVLGAAGFVFLRRRSPVASAI